jgi:phosphate transport system permease protein
MTGPDLRDRRRIGSWRTTDLLALGGSFAAALALTWLVFARLAPLNGPIGFVVVWYVLFLALYGLLVSFDESWPAVRDRVSAVAVHGLALVGLTALAFVVAYTFVRGWSALTHFNFYVRDMSLTTPLDPLTSGGILHGAVGTLIEIGLALGFTVPLGLTCAVFLTEFPGRVSRLIRTIVEAMTALPSIVAGLFTYATLILALGVPKSGFAAATAISVMMLPIVIRAADVVLRLVPGTLKEASYALGAGHWRTVWHVVLPTSRSGLTTAVILGAARGLGETSPVLLTAGFGAGVNLNPLDGPMPSLPLLTFMLIRSPQPEMVARGFGAGAVLMGVVLLLFGLARLVGGRAPGRSSRRPVATQTPVRRPPSPEPPASEPVDREKEFV